MLQPQQAHRLLFVRYLLLATLALAFTACGSVPSRSGGPPPQSPIPVAVSALIHDLETRPVANPPAYVASYDFRGQVVYYVPPRCCDIFGDLYDANGQLICHPDGGLAGNGDGRCPGFASERTNERIIWRDMRPRG